MRADCGNWRSTSSLAQCVLVGPKLPKDYVDLGANCADEDGPFLARAERPTWVWLRYASIHGYAVAQKQYLQQWRPILEMLASVLVLL